MVTVSPVTAQHCEDRGGWCSASSFRGSTQAPPSWMRRRSGCDGEHEDDLAQVGRQNAAEWDA
jgi:hypothetical protein